MGIFCVLMMLAGPSLLDAQPAGMEVRVPEVVGLPGDTLSVPVVLTGIEGYEVLAAELKIRYDPSVVHAIGAERSTLTASWILWDSVIPIDSTEVLSVALASPANPLEGGGVLAFLRFAVGSAAEAGDLTGMIFQEVLVNESVPDRIRDGHIRIVESVYPWAISPTEVDFGRMTTADSLDMTVRVAHPAPWPRTVAGLTIAPGGDAFRVVWPTLPQTVAPEDTLDVMVRFAPREAGTYSGTLRISSPAYSHPDVTVMLLGRGTRIEMTPKVGRVLVDTAGYTPTGFATVLFRVEWAAPDRTKQDVTASAEWSVADPEVGNVIGPGIAGGRRPGRTDIVAAYEAVSDTSTLEVIQLGDVNGDGVVDVEDTFRTIDHILRRRRLTDPFGISTANRNADTSPPGTDRIDILDSVKMLMLDILHRPLGSPEPVP